MTVPEMIVQSLEGTLTSEGRGYLRLFLKEQGVARFSLRRRKLALKDFTVLFPLYAPESELSHDVIVRIYLHHDRRRRRRAQSDATQLAELLTSHFRVITKRGEPELQFGVTIFFGEIYWAASK